MLWQQMHSYFESFFVFNGANWYQIVIAVALALAFGAVWLFAYRPPLLKHPPLWLVMVASAFLTLTAISFLQIPLQYYTSQALNHFWSNTTLAHWLLLAGIPLVLISGLVQEGAKMVPMVAWWWQGGKTISPKLGLAIGAAAGARFGIFESIWELGGNFAGGWTTHYIAQYGFIGIAPFWERLFAVGFHIAVSALVGYGLAKGKGWQFCLIGSVLHGLMNYGIVIYQYFSQVRGSNIITPVRLEVFIAVLAVIVTAVALILHSRQGFEEPPAEVAEQTGVASTGGLEAAVNVEPKASENEAG